MMGHNRNTSNDKALIDEVNIASLKIYDNLKYVSRVKLKLHVVATP